ncbi:hypothetical protein BHE74_00044773 [Ensete ventricosum]|nr:hypothetical protein BHE74_00044773 [Ensete ventricosum]
MPSIDASEPLRLWIREKWRKIWTKRSLMGLLLGQFVSLLITSTGFSSSELARRGAAIAPWHCFFTGCFEMSERFVL